MTLTTVFPKHWSNKIFNFFNIFPFFEHYLFFHFNYSICWVLRLPFYSKFEFPHFPFLEKWWDVKSNGFQWRNSQSRRILCVYERNRKQCLQPTNFSLQITQKNRKTENRKLKNVCFSCSSSKFLTIQSRVSLFISFWLIVHCCQYLSLFFFRSL